MSETIRMSLDVTPKMKHVIETMARESGKPQADILRDAVVLLKTVKDAEKEGQSAALIDANGNLKSKLIGI